MRTWAEINVRPWLGIAILMTLVVGGLTIYRWSEARQERWLVEQGTPTPAKVVQIGLARERQAPRDESQRVVLRYVGPDGRTIDSMGMLPRRPGGLVALEEQMTVRIDPKNPMQWTERTEPPLILAEMLVPLLLVPIALLCIAAALWQRHRVVSALRNGQRTTGRVVSMKQSSLAPMSKHLSVTVDGPDRRIRHCYWPTRHGSIEKGDAVDLIAGSNGIVLPSKSYPMA
ncbi:MAG TPA: hypothetical protein VGB55_15085 [Tepidisphaeraceae bacterium]